MSEQAESDDASAYVLGLDIGGTKLAAGVVDVDGRALSMLTRPTGVRRGVDAVVADLLDLGRDAVDRSGVPWRAIHRVGVGCGGPLDTDSGVVHGPPNLPGWDDVAIVDRCRSAYGLPVRLENDGVAAALAEHRHGAGRDTDTMVYLTISTGVGGGVLIDGQPLRGRTGNGGELGHMILVHDGRACPCGSRGCLEAYASGTAIAARARERLSEGCASTLGDLERPTAADVAAAARHGDRLAAEVWAETAAILGDGIASLANLFEARAVILGGGVTRAGDQLLGPVRDRVEARAFRFDAPVSVQPAALGDTVGVVGAATAAREAFEPTSSTLAIDGTIRKVHHA